jgi:hypothetical protein
LWLGSRSGGYSRDYRFVRERVGEDGQIALRLEGEPMLRDQLARREVAGDF